MEANKEAQRIAGLYPKFITDEILDWINYVHQELNKATQLIEGHKQITDYLIENTEVYDFIKKTDLDDIQIMLKSKTQTDSVNINDNYSILRIINLLKELTASPFTGKGHTYPKRTKGGQRGQTVTKSIKQQVMRDLYLLYKRKYQRVDRVYNFIKDIFISANIKTGLSDSMIDKTIDIKTWKHKIIFREIDQQIKAKSKAR